MYNVLLDIPKENKMRHKDANGWLDVDYSREILYLVKHYVTMFNSRMVFCSFFIGAANFYNMFNPIYHGIDPASSYTPGKVIVNPLHCYAERGGH